VVNFCPFLNLFKMFEFIARMCYINVANDGKDNEQIRPKGT
jgi:hypothetical protein